MFYHLKVIQGKQVLYSGCGLGSVHKYFGETYCFYHKVMPCLKMKVACSPDNPQNHNLNHSSV